MSALLEELTGCWLWRGRFSQRRTGFRPAPPPEAACVTAERGTGDGEQLWMQVGSGFNDAGWQVGVGGRSQMENRRVLSRLLRLRELEEEQSRIKLEVVARARELVARADDSVKARLRAGLREAGAGLLSGEALTRMAGQAAVEVGIQWQDRLVIRIRETEAELVRQREEFLVRRTSRRQVEMLAEADEKICREKAERQAQQMLDDWFGQKRHANASSHKAILQKTADIQGSQNSDL